MIDLKIGTKVKVNGKHGIIKDSTFIPCTQIVCNHCIAQGICEKLEIACMSHERKDKKDVYICEIVFDK